MYKVNKGLIIQKIDNKVVIFDGEKSLLYTFNETASFIFKKLKLNWGKDTIIKEITKKYDIEQKRAEKDFKELISDLKKKRIIYVERPKK